LHRLVSEILLMSASQIPRIIGMCFQQPARDKCSYKKNPRELPPLFYHVRTQ
jgi:hypothetical protein